MMTRTYMIALTYFFLLTTTFFLTPQSSPPALSANSPVTSELWRYPLTTRYPIGESFQKPQSRYGAGHRGLDILAPPGTEALAPQSGTVHFVGTVAHKPVITIRVDSQTLYTLEPVSSDLVQGERVDRSAPLGVVDVGGHCAASCVHLGVRINEEYVNPLRFFSERPKLLPTGQ